VRRKLLRLNFAQLAPQRRSQQGIRSQFSARRPCHADEIAQNPRWRKLPRLPFSRGSDCKWLNCYVVSDATAAAQLPGYDGYEAAFVNFRMIASDVWSTRDAVERVRAAKSAAIGGSGLVETRR
jgi:hypothetical protein